MNIRKRLGPFIPAKINMAAKPAQKPALAETIRQEAAETESRIEALVKHGRRRAPEGFTSISAKAAVFGKNVLVVEDDARQLEGMIELFTRLGAAKVQGAVCTESALLHAKENRFDMVIFDGYLAFGGTGTDAARQMRQIYSESNPGAIMVSYSGAVRQVFKDKDAAAIFDDFAEKPDIEALLSRLAEASEKKIK